MASYVPAASVYPCPWRDSNISTPPPAPPPTNYLKDHVRIVYNDGDWPTTPKGEGSSEEQDKPASQPLSLLTAKMREYTRTEEPGSGGPDLEYILKERQSAISAEQSMSAAKADIPQTEVPLLKTNKVVARSRMNSRAPYTVDAANATQQPAAKPRGRIQVMFNQTMKEKENLPLISPDFDDLDDSLQAADPQRTSGEDVRGINTQLFVYTGLPNPFLDSDEEYEEYEDLANGGWRENWEARAEEEAYSDQESSSFECDSSYSALPMILDSNPALAHPSPPPKVTSRGMTDQTEISLPLPNEQ